MLSIGEKKRKRIERFDFYSLSLFFVCFFESSITNDEIKDKMSTSRYAVVRRLSRVLLFPLHGHMTTNKR
jgi:hypothetical protein